MSAARAGQLLRKPLTGADVARGLRLLADEFEAGAIDFADVFYADQALRVDLQMVSPEAVRAVAARFGREEIVHDGYAHLDLPFGVRNEDIDSEVESWWSPRYRSTAILRLSYVPPRTEADPAPSDAPADAGAVVS